MRECGGEKEVELKKKKKKKQAAFNKCSSVCNRGERISCTDWCSLC